MNHLFTYSNQDFVADLYRAKKDAAGTVPTSSNFDTVLKAGWTDRMSRGLFRYHLGDLQTRILPGRRCYVAQLNIQRGLQRRKPQEILSIRQQFNATQFNFNKINPREVIFEMAKRPGHCAASAENERSCEPCRMLVLVNVSPLEFGHCLFVPEPSRCLPQILTRFAIRTGIESVLLSADPGFRVGFNSLGAFASVNHLHLHGYYLNHELHVEWMTAKPLVPERGFFRLAEFPAGFLFYTEADDVEKVAGAISQVTDFLVDANIAHNLFFTRGCSPYEVEDENEHTPKRGVRIIVWPRKSCFGAKEGSAFNVALCELAGHLPFKNRDDFDHMTEKDVMDVVQGYLLPNEELLKLQQQLTAHLTD
ncbi:GDP-D-glucose phosphorylase 1 [Lampris incognitus]|uniref:GDP-D-glucose phosphorylase 1 n=1 Tax=Lampris incognitus TaxID=2546036 RepID=UPI0024B4824D|nr:GDP-D-glucose phosphorylase 1 [Lampris incognitus]